MNKELLTKILEPFVIFGLIIAAGLFVLILFAAFYLMVAGFMFCVYYGWPFWLGIVWAVLAFWSYGILFQMLPEF